MLNITEESLKIIERTFLETITLTCTQIIRKEYASDLLNSDTLTPTQIEQIQWETIKTSNEELDNLRKSINLNSGDWRDLMAKADLSSQYKTYKEWAETTLAPQLCIAEK